MKRSEMVNILRKSLSESVSWSPTYEQADKILSKLEASGMMPPSRSNMIRIPTSNTGIAGFVDELMSLHRWDLEEDDK